jgi:hypothetical protein
MIVADYFKCRNSAIFNSVISPAPEMRFISRSFLPMAIAVTVGELPVFRETGCLDRKFDFCMLFINKGYRHNACILYFMRSGLTIFVKGGNQVMSDHLG